MFQINHFSVPTSKRGLTHSDDRPNTVSLHCFLRLSLFELENNNNKVRHAHVIICIGWLGPAAVWFGHSGRNPTDTDEYIFTNFVYIFKKK